SPDPQTSPRRTTPSAAVSSTARTAVGSREGCLVEARDDVLGVALDPLERRHPLAANVERAEAAPGETASLGGVDGAWNVPFESDPPADRPAQERGYGREERLRVRVERVREELLCRRD